MANKDLASLQFPGLSNTYIVPKEIAWMTYGTSTSADIEAAYQANKLVAVIATISSVPYVLILSSRISSTDHVFTAADSAGFLYAECDNGTWTSGVTSSPRPQSSGTPAALGAAAIGTSVFYSRADHRHPLPLKYTTLTIATTDWSSLSCTKTVTGMTSTAIVWLEYSDTTTAFTCTQGTDSLTFGCDATPSASVTVKVAFMEGISL